MREQPKDRDRLLHILEAIQNVNLFMENKSQEDLQKDRMLYYAVVKNTPTKVVALPY